MPSPCDRCLFTRPTRPSPSLNSTGCSAPGGRLSLFEPINRFRLPEPPDRFFGYDVGPVADLATKVKAVFDAIHPVQSDPMVNFDERDLIRLAEECGFVEVHLRLQVDIHRPEPRAWNTYLHSSGNPRAPTLAEAMEEALSVEEASRLSDHLHPLVEEGIGRRRMALAYLWAVR